MAEQYTVKAEDFGDGIVVGRTDRASGQMLVRQESTRQVLAAVLTWVQRQHQGDVSVEIGGKRLTLSVSDAGQASTAVPYRVQTSEEFSAWQQAGDASTYLIVRDDAPHAPTLVWTGEDETWHGVRPVSEDDGPFDALPQAVQATLGVPVGSIEPDGYGEEESFTPFTVLWHDALPATAAQEVRAA